MGWAQGSLSLTRIATSSGTEHTNKSLCWVCLDLLGGWWGAVWRGESSGGVGHDVTDPLSRGHPHPYCHVIRPEGCIWKWRTLFPSLGFSLVIADRASTLDQYEPVQGVCSATDASGVIEFYEALYERLWKKITVTISSNNMNPPPLAFLARCM
jgi:hypothetical protein